MVAGDDELTTQASSADGGMHAHISSVTAKEGERRTNLPTPRATALPKVMCTTPRLPEITVKNVLEYFRVERSWNGDTGVTQIGNNFYTLTRIDTKNKISSAHFPPVSVHDS